MAFKDSLKAAFDDIKEAVLLDDDDEDDDAEYERAVRKQQQKEKSRTSSAGRSSGNRTSSGAGRTQTSAGSSTRKSDSGSRSSSYSESSSRKSEDDYAEKSYKQSQSSGSSYKSRYSSADRALDPPRSPEPAYKAPSSYAKRRPSEDPSDIIIYNIKAFDDATKICDSLKNGRSIIVSFESTPAADSQRIMDFVCGSLYVLGGNLHRVTDCIFVFSPQDVEVTGDYINLVKANSFGVPTFTL